MWVSGTTPVLLDTFPQTGKFFPGTWFLSATLKEIKRENKMTYRDFSEGKGEL